MNAPLLAARSLSRPRRNRRSPAIRDLVRETVLTPADLLYPLFVHDAPQDQAIAAMPGCHRWSLEGLIAEVGRAAALGIRGVVLFPKIDDALKTADAAECFNPDGLIPRAIRRIKAAYPQILVMTDVALDPYSSEGHDGLVSPTGEILNDESIAVLARQAVEQARAGADWIGPSDMMDGRVAVIRQALDAAGFAGVGIIAYTAKYASAFYGPFRAALDSAPRPSGAKPIPGDKKTYQMDPANSREALREAALDEAEGADVLMVKPAGAYLDVIAKMRAATTLPIAAYQVSGEYAMLRAAIAAGALDERAGVLESLLAIKRAGAELILSYFAPQAAAWLQDGDR